MNVYHRKLKVKSAKEASITFTATLKTLKTSSWFIYSFFRGNGTHQQIFSCSKLITETLEKCVKCVQSQQQRRPGDFIVNF